MSVNWLTLLYKGSASAVAKTDSWSYLALHCSSAMARFHSETLRPRTNLLAFFRRSSEPAGTVSQVIPVSVLCDP